MDGLTRNSRELTAAEAFAWLRIGGATLVAVAVLLGGEEPDAAFFVVLGAAAAYAVVLAVLARRGRRSTPRVEISLADVAFILALIGFSGGALSDARLALAIYPVAMGLAYTGRAIAAVSAAAAAGFVAVSASSLDAPGAEAAFVETLAAMAIFGAMGVALAGILVFGEEVSYTRLFCLALILAGVVGLRLTGT